MSEEKKNDVVEDDESERKLYERLAKKYGTVNPSVNITVPDTSIELVYMSDSLGHLKTHDVDLSFTKMGQRFSLSRTQMDEIVGAYSRWFDLGILAVSPKDVAYAADKGIRTSSEFAIDAKILESLGTKTPEEIDVLWNDKSLTSAQRLAICTYFKKCFIANEPGYRDLGRVSALNSLTHGGFKAEVSELTDKNFKYGPLDMSCEKQEINLDFSQEVVDKDYRSDK